MTIKLSKQELADHIVTLVVHILLLEKKESQVRPSLSCTPSKNGMFLLPRRSDKESEKVQTSGRDVLTVRRRSQRC